MEKVRRYIVFLLGLFINSMGVGLITKANLGTSPISAIPYVLSLRFSLSLGEFTILFSLLLVAAQLLILRNQNIGFRYRYPLPLAILLILDCG